MTVAGETPQVRRAVTGGTPVVPEGGPVVPEGGTPVVPLVVPLRVRELAARFGLNENFVEVALADTIRHAQPWYVTALAGLGTWVGAFLVALAMFTMDLFESDGARLICGLMAMIAGACASRLDRGVVATQVTMIGVVAGQLLFLSAFAAGDDDVAIIVGLLLQVAVIGAVDRPLTKALAALAFFAFLLVFLDDTLRMPADALPIIAAVLAAGAWLFERSLLPLPIAGSSVRPVGVASVLALCGFLMFEATAMSTGVTRSPFTLASPAALAIVLGIVAAGALVVLARRREGVHRATAVVAAVAIAVGVLLSLEAPGLVAALLVVVLGVGARARILIGVGLLFLFAFLALTYYRLDVTLTEKALWAAATGTLVLVVRALVLAQYRRDGNGNGQGNNGSLGARMRGRITTGAFARERRSAQLVVIATALALGVAAALVAHKERMLATGEHVLLPLAPRDPRSLMQGDYMELRTVVAADALTTLRDTTLREDAQRKGLVVVRVDEERVATFVRFDDGAPLAPDERRLKYRLRGSSWTMHVRIGAEELFFEEGRGDHFAKARFGEVVVDGDGDGDVILVGVRDAEKVPL